LCDATPPGSILFGFAPNAELCLSFRWPIELYSQSI
jgi:hypothetical protein